MNYTFDKTTGTIRGYSGDEKNIVIPNEIDGVAVKIIHRYAFNQFFGGSRKLKNLILPDTLEEIGKNAFSGNELTTIVIPKNVTKIDSSAFENNNLVEVKLPNRLVEIGRKAFANNELEEIIIPVCVMKIGKRAFENNNLKNVEIRGHKNMSSEHRFQDSWVDIGFPAKLLSNSNLVASGDYVYEPNTNTIVEYIGTDENIVVPSEIDGIKIETIGEKAFEKRKSYDLKEVVISEGIKTIRQYAFMDNSITKLTLPQSLLAIEKMAFENNNLEKIELPDSLEVIGFCTFRENNLTELTIPSTMKTIASQAFYKNQIAKLVLPAGLNKIESIAFGENKIKTLEIPDTVVSIEFAAFANNQLTKLILPINIETIEDSAFEDNNLVNIEIPESVKHIEEEAFANNPLETIKIAGGLQSIDRSAFSDILQIVNGLGENSQNLTDYEIVNTLVTLLKISKAEETADIIELLSNYPEYKSSYEVLATTKDKNAKLAGDCLLRYIEANEIINQSIDKQIEFLQKGVTKQGLKQLEQLNLSNIPILHLNNGEQADEELVKSCIAPFFNFKQMMLPVEANLIKSMFKKEDLNKIAEYILNQWIESGMDNKLKTALIFSSYFASEQLVYKIKDLVKEMVNTNRYKAAQQILQALAYNGSKLSFMLLDEISVKGKTKGQKVEAKRLLEKAARIAKVKLDELLDMIVPDFDFDDNGVLKLEDKQSSVEILLEENGKLSYRNEAGKPTKTLPKSGENFKKEINVIKKQIKTVAKTQVNRLEMAFMSGRKWDKEVFIDLFVKNPFMRQISEGLVFKSKTTNKENITFTVTNEKTLETFSYEEVSLANLSEVYLMHSAEETTETLKGWKTYLKDNTSKPCIEQFGIDNYEIQNPNECFITKYNGCKPLNEKTAASAIHQKLTKLGFIQSEADYDTINDYQIKIDALDLKVNINFIYGFYVVVEDTEELEIGNLSFIGLKDNTEIKLSEIPNRLIATIIHRLDKIFK